jgi:hypothetical protein
VEVGNTRKLFGQGGVPADDAPAVPEDADDATVLPVAVLKDFSICPSSSLAISFVAAARLISLIKLGHGPFSSSSRSGVSYFFMQSSFYWFC